MDWKLISASNHCGAMNKMLQYLLIWETSLSDEMPYHCYQVRECWQASYLIQSAHKLTDIDVEGVSLLTAAQARLIENKSQNERQKPSWFNTQHSTAFKCRCRRRCICSPSQNWVQQIRGNMLYFFPTEEFLPFESLCQVLFACNPNLHEVVRGCFHFCIA